jgi:hypothetical protein
MSFDRRQFLTGLVVIAAPAIVRPWNIMPVKVLPKELLPGLYNAQIAKVDLAKDGLSIIVGMQINNDGTVRAFKMRL